MSYEYQRLSPLDTAFLEIEDHSAYMHMAGTSIFDLGPLRTEAGGVNFELIEQQIELLLPRMPRYRQKLDWIPIERHPVWVDDPNFNLHYHLRHTGLPKPGDTRQLKRLIARILSQPLDRGKPLWETWVIEGLEGDRFAMVSKVHHCMIDGVGGVELAQLMLRDRPEAPRLPEPHTYVPRPQPSAVQLVVDELRRRFQLPLDALRQLGPSGAAEELPEGSESAGQGSASQGGGLASIFRTLGSALHQPKSSPLNAQIGPHRRFDWTSMSLEEMKQTGKRLGGSVNDVALAVVTGAVRRFFQQRGAEPQEPFRVLTPVSMRVSHGDTFGNRVSGWIVELPIEERDPAQRIRKIAEQTREFKEKHQASGGQSLIALTDWLPGLLFSIGARAAVHTLPFNMIVTNVPGMQQPVYLMGAKLLETYGTVPIAAHLGLGIAITSYDGRMFWGLHADWDVLPDLHDFALGIDVAFERLQKAAQG